MAWLLGKKKTRGEDVKGKKKKGWGEESTPELQDEIMGLGKKGKSVLRSHMQESVAESAIDAVAGYSELVSGSQALVVIADARALGMIRGNKVVGSEAASFFREIESSSILVVTSPELLAEDKFIILPDEKGMNELADYSFIRQAQLPEEGQDAALSWGLMELGGNAIVYTVGEPTTLADIQQAQIEGFVHQLGTGARSARTDETMVDEPAVDLNTMEQDDSVPEVEAQDDVPTISADPVDTGSLTSVVAVESTEAIGGLPEGYDPSDFQEEVDYNELDSESFDPAGESDLDDDDFDPGVDADFFTETNAQVQTDAAVTGDIELTSDVEPEEVFEPEVDAREIGAADVKRVLDRHIFNEELNLSVDLEELLTSIGVYDTPVLVSTSDDGNWLDDQLAGIARNYNTELQARRQSMEVELEHLLNGLFRRLHEDIRELVALKGTTSYAECKRQLEENFNQAITSLSGEVAEARLKLEADFAQARTAYGERARQAAEDEYNRAHQRGHQLEMERVEDKLTETYKSAHDASLQELLKERQGDAHDMWNLGYQRIKGLALRYWQERQVDFDALRQEAYGHLNDYVDSFRKDELARVEVLAEEHARQDAVAVLKERMEAQSAAYEASLAERDAAHSLLVADMTTSLREAEGQRAEALRANDEKWEELTERLKADHALENQNLQARLEARIDELNSTVEQERQSKIELQESVSAQVDERTKSYRETISSREALIAAKTEEAAEAQRRAEMAVIDAERRSRVNIGMWIAIAIIACIVGFLVGDRFSAGSGVGGQVDVQLVFESLSAWLM